MSDDFDYDEDENTADEQSRQEPRENHNLKQLREKANKYDTTAAENLTLKRELEFFKTGIPDTKATQYFRRGYDGDLDVAAIRAAAAEAGFIDAEDEPGQQDEEFEALDRMSAASTGGQPPGAGVVTPATYSSWPRDKRMAFMDKYPDLTEALKRGEEVRATF